MSVHLSQDELGYLHELLAWDEAKRPTEALLSYFALALGGVMIVAAAILTLFDLRDGTVFAVLIPGFLAGLFLIGVFVLLKGRVRDRHRIAVVARKLLERP
jgi:lipopolysaccharide export LptBFGC system permease protein LptF